MSNWLEQEEAKKRQKEQDNILATQDLEIIKNKERNLLSKLNPWASLCNRVNQVADNNLKGIGTLKIIGVKFNEERYRNDDGSYDWTYFHHSVNLYYRPFSHLLILSICEWEMTKYGDKDLGTFEKDKIIFEKLVSENELCDFLNNETQSLLILEWLTNKRQTIEGELLPGVYTEEYLPIINNIKKQKEDALAKEHLSKYENEIAHINEKIEAGGPSTSGILTFTSALLYMFFNIYVSYKIPRVNPNVINWTAIWIVKIVLASGFIIFAVIFVIKTRQLRILKKQKNNIQRLYGVKE